MDRLCQPQTKEGKRYTRFQPVSTADCRLCAVVLHGEHTLNGFRNKDLIAHLYDTFASSPRKSRQRSARDSRLIAKVKDSRLYRVTKRGYQLMSAAFHCHHKEFPAAVFQPTLA